MKAGARDGVILVTVLWTVALLATLAVAASLTFRGFAGVVAVERDRSKVDGLLTAGLEVAGGLVSSAGDIPLTAVETTVVLASGSVHLRLDDEGGRIDIGQAPPDLLAALFRAIGAPNPDAIAKQIVDWRDDNIPGSQSGPRATPAPIRPGQRRPRHRLCRRSATCASSCKFPVCVRNGLRRQNHL